MDELEKVIANFGTADKLVHPHRIPLGTEVVSIVGDWPFYAKGEFGRVVHYDRDGCMWVRFESGRTWCVTGNTPGVWHGKDTVVVA